MYTSIWVGIFHNERVKLSYFRIQYSCWNVNDLGIMTCVFSPEWRLNDLTIGPDRKFVPRFHAVPATLSYSAEAWTGRSLVFDSRMMEDILHYCWCNTIYYNIHDIQYTYHMCKYIPFSVVSKWIHSICTHISNHVLSYLLGVGTRPDFIFHVFGEAHTIWLYEHFASILQAFIKPMQPV